MREMLGDFINQILSTQADAVCDADYGTTSDNRVNHRNGYRHRPLDTRVGTVDVAIPKLRHGSFFPWAVSNIVDGRTLDYGAWWQITFLPQPHWAGIRGVYLTGVRPLGDYDMRQHLASAAHGANN